MGMVRRVNGSRHFRQHTGEEQRATWLELFFDLVFVFAVTQLSHLLLHHLTLRGALQTLFLLLVVWWAWIYTTWMTNWFDPESVLVRLVLLVVMASSLLMSVAIPEAFGKLAPLFACSYVLLQVARNAFRLCDETPFHACGESRTTPATQARPLYFFCNFIRFHGFQCFLYRGIATLLPVDTKSLDARFVEMF